MTHHHSNVRRNSLRRHAHPRPNSVIKLVKLWPYAKKKHGHEIGELYTVGYYCRDCGLDVIWLVNAAGECNWTIDKDFLARHFEVVSNSGEEDFYGETLLKRERGRI